MEDTHPAQGYCVTKDFADAWNAIDAATGVLDSTMSQRGAATQKAQDTVTAAANALDTRQEELAAIDDASHDAEIDALQLSVSVAEDSLTMAHDTLARLLNPTGEDIAAQQRQIEIQKAAVTAAEKSLATLLAGADSLDYQKQAQQVIVTQDTLASAQEDLDALLNGPTATDLRLAELDVMVAEEALASAREALEGYQTVDQIQVALRESDLKSALAALETAQSNLEGTTLTAPFAGVINSVGVSVGDQVGPQVSVAQLYDPAVVEVSGQVDEIDVLYLQVGTLAYVTMDALQGEVLQGVVSDVATTGSNQNGVVTYPVSVRVEQPAGLQLPEGLTATAQIVLRQETDALLVPIQALHGTVQEPKVSVYNGGQIEDRAVTLGINDDFWAVVTDGLAEGERIVMETQGVSTSNVGPQTVVGLGGAGFGAPGGSFQQLQQFRGGGGGAVVRPQRP